MSEEQQAPTAGEEAEETDAPSVNETETADELTVDELAEAKAQAEDYKRSLQRTQADFINYKRRMEQERQDLEAMAGAVAIRSILPVLDDFDRALAALPAEGAPEGSWSSGVVQIVRKLQTVLAQQGLTPIEAVGQDFDPAQHEAVMQAEAGPEMEGKVTAEARRGYRLKGRVLRAAQVVVGKAAE